MSTGLRVAVFGSLAFGALASSAFACELPPLVVITPRVLDANEAPAVRKATNAYFESMTGYVACVQAELAAAGGAAAPAVVKAVIVARNNAAVAEADAVNKMFEANGYGGAMPGSEAALRKLIEGISSGMPDYEAMTPEMADVTRQQLARLRSEARAGGSIQSIAYGGVDDRDWDVYDVRLEKFSTQWHIALAADGKIGGALVVRSPVER